MRVSVLDYGAGNVRSLLNALAAVGCEVEMIETAEQIAAARVLIFPGVGSFGKCMQVLQERGWVQALTDYVKADRPYLGICLGLQTLFEASAESPGIAGLGLLPGKVERFKGAGGRSVPQIGWNTLRALQPSGLLEGVLPSDAVYFVHSFRAARTDALEPWALTATDYGEQYVSSVQRGRVLACQFHPEKSGAVGLRMLRNFVAGALSDTPAPPPPLPPGGAAASGPTRYCKRIIACMDVRANDKGDLVCTKGDQYDVREKSEGGQVRNLGKPVALAKKYYDQGADEITFLNITGFRDFPLNDTPSKPRHARTAPFAPPSLRPLSAHAFASCRASAGSDTGGFQGNLRAAHRRRRHTRLHRRQRGDLECAAGGGCVLPGGRGQDLDRL